MVELSPTQKRALDKLIEHGGWECSYVLRESLATLNSLVKKGYIQRRSRDPGGLGTVYSPQIGWLFKAIKLRKG